MANDTTYEIRFTITVDRPELRNATFAPVAAGTKIQIVQRTTSHASAIRRYEELMAGSDDFSSEYVSSACVEGAPGARNLNPVATRRRGRAANPSRGHLPSRGGRAMDQTTETDTTSATPAPPATCYVAIALYYWGKGPTIAEAERQLEHAGWSPRRKNDQGYLVKQLPAGAKPESVRVDDYGTIVWEWSAPPDEDAPEEAHRCTTVKDCRRTPRGRR